MPSYVHHSSQLTACATEIKMEMKFNYSIAGRSLGKYYIVSKCHGILCNE